MARKYPKSTRSSGYRTVRRLRMVSYQRKRSKAKFTLPIAMVAGFGPLVVNTMNTPGGLEPKGWMLTQALTGFDTRTQKWWFPNMYKGAVPILAGVAVHKVANMLGINRMLASAGIPIIRV